MSIHRFQTVLFILVLLSGCATYEEPQKNPVFPPGQFSYSGTSMAPDRWWKAFDDPELNRLVDQALHSNFNIKAAWDRLDAARAVVAQESSSLYPGLDVGVGADRSDNNGAGNTFSGDLTADYEVDLWGRIDSRAEAAEFSRQASRQQLKSAAISVAGEVTITWYQLVGEYGKKRLLKKQIQNNKDVLKIVETRFRNGFVGASDVLRQRRLVKSTRQQLHTVESRIEILEHKLAVLLGQTPNSNVAESKNELPEVPKLPSTGVPSKLIHRRPDLLRAFYEMKSADRDLAAAVSNQYPRITLTASVSDRESQTKNLLEDGIQSVAADLSMTLIDFDSERAAVRQQRSERARLLHKWAQSTLEAFQEVEDALQKEQSQRKSIKRIREQVKLAEQTTEQLKSKYYNGSIDYIDVLDALSSEQELRRDLISARVELIEHRVVLYRALAGGFPLERS
ncbi:MAG: TolC family protein [bacterium]